MKRILIAIVILGSGTTLFCAWRGATLELQQQTARERETWLSQTQLLGQAKIQLTSLEQRVHDLAETLRFQPHPAQATTEPLIGLLTSTNLSPAQRERLLAELGFDWNSSKDYLMVNKKTLGAVSLRGIRKGKLSDAACEVLAITPEERAGIEASMNGMAEDYKNWAEAHVQRTEPHGDIIAQYTLPGDAEFSQTLSNNFATAVASTLGAERGKLLLQYSQDWMQEAGLQGGDCSLTIKRHESAGEGRLAYELKYSGSSVSGDLSPHQPVLEAFLPLFPAGWTDLAKREGFELPKEFQKK